MRLFDPALVYPRDDTGAYIELEGEVVEVRPLSAEDCMVVVATEKGQFTGAWEGPRVNPCLPSVGYTATIRVYDAGGGFYPDNKITGWRVRGQA